MCYIITKCNILAYINVNWRTSAVSFSTGWRTATVGFEALNLEEWAQTLECLELLRSTLRLGSASVLGFETLALKLMRVDRRMLPFVRDGEQGRLRRD